MDIDAVIAEHVAQAEAQAQPAEAKIEAKDAEVTTQEEAQVETDETEESAEETEAKTEELFPKKAVNALQRKEKKIGKLTTRLEYEQQARQQLEARLAKYEGNQQQEKPKAPQVDTDNLNNPDGSPNEEAYERAGKNYGDYLKATARYEARQELADNNKKTQESQRAEQINAWKAEKETAVAQRAVEVMKQIPDYEELVQDNSELLDAFDDTPIEQAFLEADNGELAFYALAKEGKLESLFQMSPARVAIEIAKAEERGRSYLKPKQTVTNAPAPISPAKGNGTVSKPLASQSVDQLMKNMGFRT